MLETITEECINKLIEHSDSVRIFATFQEDDITKSLTLGRGNFYSQYGLIKEWLIRQDEIAKQVENK